MRLSEAIRLGALLKPQVYDGNTDQGSCALAAAADACGIAPVFDREQGHHIVSYALLYQRFPLLTTEWRGGTCPHERAVSIRNACYLQSAALIQEVIWHLNDWHHWTREAIADWVETLELQQESACTKEVLTRS